MLSEFWSDLRYRVRAVFRRDAVEQELDLELEFHIEQEARKYERDGIPHAEALRRARLAFGGMNRIKDDTRDARGTTFVETFAQDVRYALRGLRARPGFTTAVVVTLGLGIGVNTAMFGVLDRALFRPPAYLRDASSVHRMFTTWTAIDGRQPPNRSFEYARYLDIARETRATSQVGAYSTRMIAVGDGDDARIVPVAAMSASVFEFFDAKPVLGRFFTRSEDSLPAGSPVTVISHELWSSQYGGRPSVLGATLRVGPATYRIIGVAPPGFRAFTEGRAPVAFAPITHIASIISADFAKGYAWSWFDIFIRSKPGITDVEATADLTSAYRVSWNVERALVPGLAPIETAKPEAIAAPVQLGRGPTAGPETKVMKWVSGVASIVLVVACANVANLLLTRALRRRREIAVRRALGGSRARIVRQLLTETFILSALGGAAGLGAAHVTSTLFGKLFLPASDPTRVASDARTLGFALTLTLLAALLAGLVPALHAGRDDLADSLRAGMREGTYRSSRARTTLLVFQTALSVVLLVGAGLFVRSLNAVRTLRLGYDVDPIVVAQYNARGVKLSPAERSTLGDRLLAEARAIPGVVNATLNISIPFNTSEGRSLFVPGIDSIRKLGRFELQAGSTDYFATMGTRILRGRGFTDDDRANSPPVVVVSEAMGKAVWKGENPIGKCIRIGRDTMPCTTVVGVAENTRARQLTNDSELAYYMPMDQYRVAFGPAAPALYVRVNGRGDDYAEVIRSRLQSLVAGPSYVMTTPFHAIVDPTMRSWQSGATTFMAFGGLALALAAIGLYAVVAFSVSQRRQELGVRIALGALPRDVLRLVVAEGLRVTVVGIAAGGAIALLASRGVAPLLFQVSPRDPVVYAAVGGLLAAVGIAASMVPAMRASRVDPNTALRAE